MVVTVVKKSEDDDAIVVRAYDSSGRGGPRSSCRSSNTIAADFGPAEIKTFRVPRPEVAVDGDRPARVVSSLDGDEWRLRANARPRRAGGGGEPIELPANQLRFYRGGARIAAFRGLVSVDDQAPEDWVASTTVVHGDSQFGLSRLPDGGRLRDAIEADPEAFLGHAHVERFGADPALLVKLLDAGERLPLHLHPDASFAQRHLDSRWGKTEAWIIVDAVPGATVHVGFTRELESDEFSSSCASRTWTRSSVRCTAFRRRR